ncbi:hypothetical protein [Halorubrum lacusprofundi]|jgi:hypothetical protein|uniref:hypothetical protein n=1 Tax=Halorubrum lacusprofundi TaxID=2247 RepID=UPI0006776507|nr:hypothetical protein [Halorubrum lacusprofundi]
MARSIKLADDLYQELGDFGNRDESWNDVLARVLVHVDEDAALEDRNNRATTYNSQGAEAEDSELSELPDGTIVRHRYQRGDYGGETVEATIQGGRLSVEDDTQETRSPTGAARVADKQLRGDDARGEGYNGWTWWEYETEDGDWEPITELAEG